MSEASLGEAIDRLIAAVSERAAADPEESYTASLLSAGPQRCAKKLGEEAVETALAAVSGDKEATAAEAADLLYHLVVLLKASDVAPLAVADALKRRRNISGHQEKQNRA